MLQLNCTHDFCHLELDERVRYFSGCMVLCKELACFLCPAFCNKPSVFVSGTIYTYLISYISDRAHRGDSGTAQKRTT